MYTVHFIMRENSVIRQFDFTVSALTRAGKNVTNLINLHGFFGFSPFFHQRGTAVGYWCDVIICQVLVLDSMEMICVFIKICSEIWL